MAVTIRPTTADDWQQVRELRLEALADTPIAFAEHLADGLAADEANWRARAARGTNPHSAYLAAIDDDRWVGTMGGFISPEGPLLVGVYVSPSHRSTSVAVDLLAGIEAWARTEGDALLLHVHEQNPRARAFYARQGYTETGATTPYVLDATALEIEMVKRF